MEKFCIFSDEAGSWSDRTEDYYVRAWVEYDQGAYFEIQKNNELLSKLFELNLSEIKWKNYSSFFRNHPEVLDNLFLYPPKIFIEFTIMEEFKDRHFNIREDIASTLRHIKQEDVKERQYLGDISRKVMTSINGILFLNIYERFNITNALEGLTKTDKQYYIFIDKPQFIERDFRTLLSGCVRDLNLTDNILRRNLSDSKDHLGIQVADLIAGCFNKLLETKFTDTDSLEFYNSYIKPHCINKGNITKGINKVIKNPKSDSQLEIVKVIKNN